MDEQNELTEEEKKRINENIVLIVNTAIDIMEGKEIGTTKDGNKHIAPLVEEIVKKDNGMNFCKLPDEQIKVLSSLFIFGYNTFGAEFIERLEKNNPELEKSVLYSLAKIAGGEEMK